MQGTVTSVADKRGSVLGAARHVPALPAARARVACRAQQQSALEMMLGARKIMVLDRGQQDLFELCSDLASDEERRRCWEVYRYFTERRSGAQAACLQELQQQGKPGESCEDFDTLQRMVFELMSSGRTSQLYTVLKVEEELARARAAGTPAREHAPSAEEREHEAHVDHLRARADTLFDAMNAKGSGYVDREEFILAMNMLRDELGWDEAELGTVFSAIDCHGHVSREQFADIVISEDLRDPAADAELLRHIARPKASRGWRATCTWEGTLTA